MGTSLSQNYHLQKCEPGIAAGAIANEPLFAGRYRPAVSGEFDGDGDCHTYGLGFEEYSRMQTLRRTVSPCRRLPTPSWATNTSELRMLLVHFFETRAQIRKPGTGSEIQRLNEAQRILLASIPKLVVVLDRLMREYADLRKTGADPARARMLEGQIQNLDTSIRMARMGAGGVARMIHLYFCCGYDSVGTASEIGVTPVHVRQTLYKLRKLAERVI